MSAVPKPSRALTTDRKIAIGLVVLLTIAYAWVLPGPTGEETASWQGSLYREALLIHFWDYIAYSPLKPPLFTILHALAIQAGSLVGASELISLHILAAGLNIIVGPLLFAAGVNFGGNRALSAIFAAITALALIVPTFKTLNYDLPVFFFLALFLFAASRVFQSRGDRGWLPLALAAGLLVAQSTVQAAIVPASTILLGFIVGRRDRLYRLAANCAFVILTVAVVLAAIITKNYIATGFATNSTLGGHTLMLFVQNLAGLDQARVRAWIDQAGAPDWYKWCFDNPADWREAGPAPWFMSSLGHCWHRGRFDQLKAQMERLGAQEQADIVARDIARWTAKPYLLSGVAPDMATEWFAAYSRESARVARYVFQSDPAAWLRAAAHTHGHQLTPPQSDVLPIWAGRETALSVEPQKTAMRWVIGAVHGMRYGMYRTLPFFILAAGLWAIASYCLAALGGPIVRHSGPVGLAILLTTILAAAAWPAFDWFYQGYRRYIYGAPYIAALIFSICYVAHARRSGGDERWLLKRYRRDVMAGLFLGLPTVFLGFLYSTVVYSENNRFFLQLLPYLTLLTTLIGSCALRELCLLVGKFRPVTRE